MVASQHAQVISNKFNVEAIAGHNFTPSCNGRDADGIALEQVALHERKSQFLDKQIPKVMGWVEWASPLNGFRHVGGKTQMSV